MEYRGYGRSSGMPSEQGMYRDAAAALAHLTGARGAAAQDVVVFGESLGGAVAVWLAEKSRPGALVVMSAFTSVPDPSPPNSIRFLPARRLARFDYDALGRIGRVACPVLVAHSPQDEIVPYAHGRRLFEAAPEPKQFLDLGGGHNDGFIYMRREWVDQPGAFLDRHRRAAP
ncbi:MAG: alpha/beta hydrolase [Chromatiales bacterium]|nr:alpha/beta hydrolase [Chromatiales bacterium]